MANIPIEKKSSGPAWWLWLLALLLLAAIIWLLAGLFDDDDEIEPDTAVGTEEVAPAPMPATGDASPTLAEIVADPSAYIGTTVPTLEAGVGDELTDRGFWLESGGARLFALLVDDPQEEPLDINPGQTLRVEGGTLRGPDALGSLRGAPLDADTQRIAEEQDIFLVVDELKIDILEAGTPQPGTDPAESLQ